MQPVAASDTAAALASLALEPPKNGIVEVAGPESGQLDDFARKRLDAAGDERLVVTDTQARYFGAILNDKSLRPYGQPLLGRTHFADWLQQNASA